MGRVSHCDRRGFINPLTEFTPETVKGKEKQVKKRKKMKKNQRVDLPVQHQFGGGLASGIFGNTGNIQSDTLSLLVPENVLPALLEGLTPTRPTLILSQVLT